MICHQAAPRIEADVRNITGAPDIERGFEEKGRRHVSQYQSLVPAFFFLSSEDLAKES